ncbi:MAG TPA: hypothetical protein DDW17_06645 [Deltaproteobacteria bacterium]|nr:hypothetical protein [Deltaproteobacteria bacterium]
MPIQSSIRHRARHDKTLRKEVDIINKGRRDFLTGHWIYSFFKTFRAAPDSTTQPADTSGYFTSFETCYPLIAEAGNMLFEEAKKRGIKIDGKSTVDIAKELFSAPLDKKRDEV